MTDGQRAASQVGKRFVASWTTFLEITRLRRYRMRLKFSLVLLLTFLISGAAYAQKVNVDSSKAVSCAAHKIYSCIRTGQFT